MRAVAIATVLCVISSVAFADDYEDLIKEGYGALAVTAVQGEFKGCQYNQRIPLQDGLIFVCSTYAYHYAYDPEVLVLKNVQTGETAVAIDGDLYDGTLYKASP